MSTIYDFLFDNNTDYGITYSIFDTNYNGGEVVKSFNGDDAHRELEQSVCSDFEIMSFDMDIIDGHIHIEFNVELDEDDRMTILSEEEWEMEHEECDRYTPSATAGDYSPSCPWNAPGMSISDFI